MRKLREVLVLVFALGIVAAFSGASVFAGTLGENPELCYSCLTQNGDSVKQLVADNCVDSAGSALTGKALRDCRRGFKKAVKDAAKAK